MTFEEFFTKKKINLVQLEKAEPSLFAEFKSHFTLMGEKSFDHTKKFWFNKLRRQYHLASPEKATTQVENTIAAQAEPLNSPTIEQKVADASIVTEPTLPKPAAKPAFRPRNIPIKTEDKKEEVTDQVSPAEQPLPVKKPAFKPRNIPSANKEAEDIKHLESRPGEVATSESPIVEVTSSTEDAASKPTYKPKFNLKNLPKSSSTSINNEVENAGPSHEPPASESSNESTAAKPAYKPKFNLKNLPKVTQKEFPPASEKLESEQNLDAEKEIAKSDIQDDAAVNKPAYKPKFNMKNLPKAIKNDGSEQQKEVASESHTEEEKKLPGAETVSVPPAEASQKPVYKPKFNMRNLPQLIQKDDTEKKEDLTPAEKTKVTEEAPIVTESTMEMSDEHSAKPVYKPRFNMRNLPKVKQQEDEEQRTAQESNPIEAAEKSAEENNLASEAPEEEPTITPKPAFKPKFGLRNVTPKPPEE